LSTLEEIELNMNLKAFNKKKDDAEKKEEKSIENDYF